MSVIQGYLDPIMYACLLFIPVAGLFTLPFMIIQYRRYGSIPVLRVLVIYSFLLYILCSYLLTVLPLPSYESVAAMKAKPIQWIPFDTYRSMFSKCGFSLSDPSSFLQSSHWRKLIHSSNLFEILANIVMQIPLGIYLRYYFRRSWKQVLLIGFLFSLFYELTQLSGLYFIYPKAYRLCSVDDLIDNTLGALIGYLIAPWVCALLPSRERLDEVSLERSRKLTLIRRFTSAVIDWLFYSILVGLFLLYVPADSGKTAMLLFISGPLYVLAVFILGQHFCHGKTIGKALLHISVRDRETGNVPTLRQLLTRYGLIYFFLPLLLSVLGMLGIMSVMLVFNAASASLRLIGIAVGFFLVVLCASCLSVVFHRHHELPHSYRSGTVILDTRKKTISSEAMLL